LHLVHRRETMVTMMAIRCRSPGTGGLRLSVLEHGFSLGFLSGGEVGFGCFAVA
jgi:hypothetical protein